MASVKRKRDTGFKTHPRNLSLYKIQNEKMQKAIDEEYPKRKRKAKKMTTDLRLKDRSTPEDIAKNILLKDEELITEDSLYANSYRIVNEKGKKEKTLKRGYGTNFFLTDRRLLNIDTTFNEEPILEKMEGDTNDKKIRIGHMKSDAHSFDYMNYNNVHHISIDIGSMTKSESVLGEKKFKWLIAIGAICAFLGILFGVWGKYEESKVFILGIILGIAGIIMILVGAFYKPIVKERTIYDIDQEKQLKLYILYPPLRWKGKKAPLATMIIDLDVQNQNLPYILKFVNKLQDQCSKIHDIKDYTDPYESEVVTKTVSLYQPCHDQKSEKKTRYISAEDSRKTSAATSKKIPKPPSTNDYTKTENQGNNSMGEKSLEDTKYLPETPSPPP